MFKPQGEAEWFKRAPQAYNSINHDKAIVVSGLYYDVKQLVSMDTTVPVVYGSYTLEYNCHILATATVYIAGRQWFS